MDSLSRASLRLLPVAVLLAAGVPSFAVIGGGPDDPNSAYRFMGRLNANGFGATPISSNWLVTARHVAPGVGTTFTNLQGTYNIAQVVDHPTADFTLFRIDASLGNASLLTQFYGYASDVSRPTEVAMLGFGRIGPIGAQPTTSPNGVRQIARNTLDSVIAINIEENAPLYDAYAYDLDDRSAALNTLGTTATVNDANGNSVESGIADFDSGGGWFVQLDGKTTLAAVSSAIGSRRDVTGTATDSNSPYVYGAVGFGTAIGHYSDFIQATTGVAPVPEPASMLALSLGAAAMTRRRKRA